MYTRIIISMDAIQYNTIQTILRKHLQHLVFYYWHQRRLTHAFTGQLNLMSQKQTGTNCIVLHCIVFSRPFSGLFLALLALVQYLSISLVHCLMMITRSTEDDMDMPPSHSEEEDEDDGGDDDEFGNDARGEGAQ